MARFQAPIAALRQRLGGRRGSGAGLLDPTDPLQVIGQQLQQRREEKDLTMRQLALDTRVSTPVIEALEKGWGERLPEPAFLGTIIQKLADRLDLDAAELNRALTEALPERDGGRRRRDGPMARFTLSSIELFSTWQGTIAYAVLVGGLLYGLNLHHRQMLLAQVTSLQPIPPAVSTTTPASDQKKSDDLGANGRLLQLHPELRPLDQPQPESLQRLKISATEASTPPSTGTIELKLPEGIKRDEVTITWNGQPIKPQADAPDSYAVPLWPSVSDQSGDAATAEPR